MQLVIDTLTFFFDRGESKLLQKGPLIGSAWKDNKILTVLSTTSQPAASGTVLRRQKDGTRVPVSCPDNIIHYNKYMGGVDRGDQLRGYYLCRTNSRKFYKFIFYFLFDVAVTNGSLQSLDWNEWTGTVDWNGVICGGVRARAGNSLTSNSSFHNDDHYQLLHINCQSNQNLMHAWVQYTILHELVEVQILSVS